MNQYIGGKKASEALGIHPRTLYLWEAKGKIDTIRTPGGKRLYNVEKLMTEIGVEKKDKPKCLKEFDGFVKGDGKFKLSYARVSSRGQANDLERQKNLISERYPDHLLIEDIGSGVNLNRKGLRKIINLAIAGKVEELVIAYKDRLTRFGFDLIEDLIKDYSGGKIIIIEAEDDLEPEEELAKDVLQIMNVFVAKMNGLRKYKCKKQE